jgi:hypothetical protein
MEDKSQHRKPTDNLKKEKRRKIKITAKIINGTAAHSLCPHLENHRALADAAGQQGGGGDHRWLGRSPVHRTTPSLRAARLDRSDRAMWPWWLDKDHRR